MLSTALKRLAVLTAVAAAPDVNAQTPPESPLPSVGRPDPFKRPDSLSALATLTGTPMPESKREDCLLHLGDATAVNVRLPRTVSDFLGTPTISGERYRAETAGDTYAAVLTNRGYMVTAGSPMVLTDDSKPVYWIFSASGSQIKPSDMRAALYSDTLFMRARLTEEFRSIVIHFQNDYARFNLEAETGKPLRIDGILSTSFGEFDVRYQKGQGGQAWYELARDDAHFKIGLIYPNSKTWEIKGVVSVDCFEGWMSYQHFGRQLNAGAKAEWDGGNFSVLAKATLDRQRPEYSIQIALEVELGPRILSRPLPVLDW